MKLLIFLYSFISLKLYAANLENKIILKRNEIYEKKTTSNIVFIESLKNKISFEIKGDSVIFKNLSLKKGETDTVSILYENSELENVLFEGNDRKNFSLRRKEYQTIISSRNSMSTRFDESKDKLHNNVFLDSSFGNKEKLEILYNLNNNNVNDYYRLMYHNFEYSFNKVKQLSTLSSPFIMRSSKNNFFSYEDKFSLNFIENNQMDSKSINFNFKNIGISYQTLDSHFIKNFLLQNVFTYEKLSLSTSVHVQKNEREDNPNQYLESFYLTNTLRFINVYDYKDFKIYSISFSNSSHNGLFYTNNYQSVTDSSTFASYLAFRKAKNLTTFSFTNNTDNNSRQESFSNNFAYTYKEYEFGFNKRLLFDKTSLFMTESNELSISRNFNNQSIRFNFIESNSTNQEKNHMFNYIHNYTNNNILFQNSFEHIIEKKYSTNNSSLRYNLNDNLSFETSFRKNFYNESTSKGLSLYYRNSKLSASANLVEDKIKDSSSKRGFFSISFTESFKTPKIFNESYQFKSKFFVDKNFNGVKDDSEEYVNISSVSLASSNKYYKLNNIDYDYFIKDIEKGDYTIILPDGIRTTMPYYLEISKNDDVSIPINYYSEKTFSFKNVIGDFVDNIDYTLNCDNGAYIKQGKNTSNFETITYPKNYNCFIEYDLMKNTSYLFSSLPEPLMIESVNDEILIKNEYNLEVNINNFNRRYITYKGKKFDVKDNKAYISIKKGHILKNKDFKELNECKSFYFEKKSHYLELDKININC